MHACMMCGEHEEEGKPREPALVGEVLINRLDISRLQKPGKRVRNIEFAALCEMRQICYTALPIEEQEYPAFPARELSCKCLCRYGRDNLEYKRCLKNPFLRAKFRHYPSRPS
jgi:hypothetical protein